MNFILKLQEPNFEITQLLPILALHHQTPFHHPKKPNNKETPLGTPEVTSFEQFLRLLNAIMTTAPEYTECIELFI